MSIIKLRAAIKKGDTEAVVSAFNEMTGEELTWASLEVEPTTKKRGRPKKTTKGVVKPAERRTKANTPKKVVKKPVITNGFFDDLTEERQYLQGKKKPRPRYNSERPKFEPVAVKCDACGATEKVSPILADRSVGGDYHYYCNKCAGKR
jgi:hypothetical protein